MKNNPKIILIGGPPVVGKSTIAYHLSKKLGVKRVVDIDVVRDIFREDKTNKREPYLYYYSTTAWRKEGDPTKQNIIRSYCKYCTCLKKAIDSAIKSAYKFRIDTIIEGVHLLPKFFEKYKKNKNLYFFIIISNKKQYLHNTLMRKKEA